MKCKHLDCYKQANYGYTKSDKNKYCKKHSKSDHKYIGPRQCHYPDCHKIAVYGTKNSRIQYCRTHAPPEDKDIYSYRCKHPDCSKSASFGEENGRIEYCKTHARPEHINLRQIRCDFKNCQTIANFVGSDISGPRYCSLHAPNGYTNLIGPRCIVYRCHRIARFSTSLDISPTYCQKHAPKDYILVKPTIWRPYVSLKKSRIQSPIIEPVNLFLKLDTDISAEPKINSIQSISTDQSSVQTSHDLLNSVFESDPFFGIESISSYLGFDL